VGLVLLVLVVLVIVPNVARDVSPASLWLDMLNPPESVRSEKEYILADRRVYTLFTPRDSHALRSGVQDFNQLNKFCGWTSLLRQACPMEFGKLARHVGGVKMVMILVVLLLL